MPFISTFGGKIAARGAKVEILEGEHDLRPIVMFEFPSMEAIHAFWNSPDYVPMKKSRVHRDITDRASPALLERSQPTQGCCGLLAAAARYVEERDLR